MKKSMVVFVFGLCLLVLVVYTTAAPARAGSPFPTSTGSNIQVNLQAAPSAVRTWNWAVNLNSTPDSWDLFRGDRGAVQYTAAVTKSGYIDVFTVQGAAQISNPSGKRQAVIKKVEGTFAGQPVTFDCGVRLPHLLKKGQTLTCAFSVTAPNGLPAGLNVSVTTVGGVGSGGAAAQVVFPAPRQVHAEVHLINDEGAQWTFSDSGMVSYEVNYGCDAHQGQQASRVTIQETGQQARASVQVNCHQLDVTMGAQGLFERIYFWDIGKTGSLSQLELQIGETGQVEYRVETRMTHTVDWRYRFKVYVIAKNNSPIVARSVSIYSALEGESAESPCAQYGTNELLPGEQRTCLYYPGTSDGEARHIWAIALLENFRYASDGSIINTVGSTAFEKRILAEYLEPSSEVFKCSPVQDSLAGTLGQVCADQSPQLFTYSMNIGPYEACGAYQVINSAWLPEFLWTEAVWTVDVNVACQP
jgi:hypothetical protein